jgi:hypothetical protein
MFTTVRTIVVWCCIILILSQSGCAHAPKPCLPDEVRAQLGTVGIVSARFRPDVDLSVPAKGRLAGAGRKSANWAGKSTITTLQGVKICGGSAPCAALIVALSVAVGTIGGMAGGVAGALQAEPSKEIAFAEEVITVVIADQKMQEILCSKVAQVARSQTRTSIVVGQDQGPSLPDEKIAYSSLAAQGIDTVLEIAITRVALTGDWDLNPPLVFQMNAHIRVLLTTDGNVLHDDSVDFSGSSLTFSEWADNNAQAVIAELDKAYQHIAENIVREVFPLIVMTLKD